MPATPTYSPLIPQNSAEYLRTYTRRYSRYAETETSSGPVGDSAAHSVRGGMTVARTGIKGEYGRQGARWGYVARCVPPIFPSRAATTRTSFRHTPTCPQPRPTAPVWRNLQQNRQHTRIRYSSFFIHHSSLSFTFSAKEKDSETGLSYFGSRYYSSDLSVWLSVDPQSDKYASLSPYVYCADNPVKLVDPNGEDVWEIDENGKLIWKEHNDNVDILYATKTRESKEFPVGTIKEMTNDKGNCDYGDQTVTVEFQYLDINDDDLASCFFEFVGENTDVEWSLMQTGENDNRIARDIQYTNKAGERLDISLGNGSWSALLERYLENNVSVRATKHSHPLGKYIVPDPSGYDRWARYWFMDHFKDKANIIYEVYGNKDGRWQYMPY